MLTQELAAALIDYNPATGEFTWKPRPDDARFTARYSGKPAGSVTPRGYLVISLSGRSVMAHRLAWLLAYGYIPEMLDHIDRDKLNNSIANLRRSTHGQNQHNRSTPRNNTSGYKGVYWSKKDGLWVAYVTLNKRKHYAGGFKTKQAAVKAVQAKRRELHGAFASDA